MGATSVITRMKVKAGSEGAFMDAVAPFLAQTRKESGCARYDVYRDTHNASFIIFHEVWKEPQAIDSHISSPHFGQFMGVAAGLLDPIVPGSASPFQVTIAVPFDPSNPPTSDKVIVATRTRANEASKNTIVSYITNSLLGPSNAEEGCDGYDLYQNTEDAGLLIFFEQWKGFGAIMAHMQTPHFGAFMAAASEKLTAPSAGGEGPFEVMICNPYTPA
jgi:quinol monooxygenase YgiN